MEKVENPGRILFYDTDSLTYVVKEGETPLPTGNYWVQLTDELGGDSVPEFAAAGPKSYAYQTRAGKVPLRVKGITQTQEVCKEIRFDSIKKLGEGYVQNPDHDAFITVTQQSQALKSLTFQYILGPTL